MEKNRQNPSLIKITTVSALLVIAVIIPRNIFGNLQRFQPAVVNVNEVRASNNLPEDLLAALSLAYGNYEALVSQETMLNDLQAADIVLIGEAHWDQRDMQTAFAITRKLAQRKRVALAVERFPLTLQPRLVALGNIVSEEKREEEMSKLFQTDDYQRVWRPNYVNQTGAPDSFDSSDLYYPSTEDFEEMMLWAARAGIPIIGLDLPPSERASGLGENIPYRNEVWKNQIADFVEKKQSENYIVVAIGGIDHLSNAPESVQAKLRMNPSITDIVSIGQRDANYSTKRSLRVEELAKANQINNLILKSPRYAVAFQSGNAIYPTPPDYWLAVHAVDNWDK